LVHPGGYRFVTLTDQGLYIIEVPKEK